ncbi:MAG: dinitrogenase iron-molybdenum cofactor biosynthesis protein [Methanospirillum sp.]|nr:dinitrogenase iron-molybdenum cofactor biosynthesis protein [Methanospirillum sp.]
MKVCITSKGTTLDSPAEERFGRAPYFIFVDTDTGSVEAVQNPFADGAGGVGPRAAQLLTSHGAGAMVSGQVGGNAREALLTAGIAMYTYGDGGTVADALEKFRNDALTRTG